MINQHNLNQLNRHYRLLPTKWNQHQQNLLLQKKRVIESFIQPIHSKRLINPSNWFYQWTIESFAHPIHYKNADFLWCVLLLSNSKTTYYSLLPWTSCTGWNVAPLRPHTAGRKGGLRHLWQCNVPQDSPPTTWISEKVYTPHRVQVSESIVGFYSLAGKPKQVYSTILRFRRTRSLTVSERSSHSGEVNW